MGMFVILQKYDFSSKSQQFCGISRSFADVCDTAKVRFFKQITTTAAATRMFARCLWYCKSTIFQANHNGGRTWKWTAPDVCDTAKVRFFKQITTLRVFHVYVVRCLWYCKSTIFQANHNSLYSILDFRHDVCNTAKVRFFKQITTN